MRALKQFWAFARLSFARVKGADTAAVVWAFFAVALNMFTGMDAADISSAHAQEILFTVDFTSLALLAMGLVAAYSAANAHLCLLPLTSKRRGRHLLGVYYAIAAAVTLAGLGVFALVSEYMRANAPFRELYDHTIVWLVSPGACAYAFCALRYILVSACAVTMSRIAGRKKTAFAVTFVLVYTLANLAPIFMARAADGEEIYGQFNTLYSLDIMPLGWLYVAIYGAITACAVVISAVAVTSRTYFPPEE